MPELSVISVLNVVSGAVAFLISYYAYRNNKLVESTLLRYISIGFLLLAVGLVMQGLTVSFGALTPLDALHIRAARLTTFIVFTGLQLIQLIAYIIFAWGYGLSHLRVNRSPNPPSAAAVPASLSFVLASGSGRAFAYILLFVSLYYFTQTGIVVLLFIIVILGASIFSRTHSNLALMVLFGFALIFGGHVLMLASVIVLSSTAFLMGNTIEFCGFLALLFFLIWSGRVGK